MPRGVFAQGPPDERIAIGCRAAGNGSLDKFELLLIEFHAHDLISHPVVLPILAIRFMYTSNDHADFPAHR